MNKKVTRESKFVAEYLKIQNEAINKRISLEFNKHNWLLKRLYNQTQKKYKIQAIEKKKTFKHKKSTKKSVTHATVPMNFYKEQDITNCKKTQTVPPTYPNTGTIQKTNKQTVKRDLHRTMHNIANSQIKKTRYQRNDNTVYPLSDSQKSIKHNLPIVFQPDRKSYVTCNSNILKDTLSSNTHETSGRTSSNDNMLKRPDRPAAVANYIKTQSSETPQQESSGESTFLKNLPSNVLNEVIIHHNDSPIHLWNSNNNVLNGQNIANNYFDSKINKNIKIDEESLKIILQLCKENENFIIETYMSKITDLFNHAKDNARTDKYKILKVARTISEIYKIIADTVTKAFQQIFTNKSTQTGMNNRLEYTNYFPPASVHSNNNSKQNAANDEETDRNEDCINLQQQEFNQQKYQIYQQQQRQTNFRPYKTNDTLNYENQSQKDFRQGFDAVPITYQKQNVLSNTSFSHIQQPTSQYSVINERRNYQQNWNRIDNEKREGIQNQHLQNSNAQNVKQQRYAHRLMSENSNANREEYMNRNSMAPVIQKQFATTYGQQEREYVENQMSNDKELQKRKTLYGRDGFTISSEGPTLINQNSLSIPELPKRQRYEDFSNDVIDMKDTSSSHKNDGDNMTPENKPSETEAGGFHRKNITSKPADGDKLLYESYNLDDDEDIQLTINEDSFNTLFSLSQQNKNLLMKNYVSRFSEIDNPTQKYGDSDENNLEIASKKIAQVFQAVMEKIVKSYQPDKPQLKTQMIHQCTQTVVQNETEYKSDKIDATVQNPIDTVNCNENENVNNLHVQQPNEMYGYHPNYQGLQQYRNPSNQNQPNQNQVQPKQHKATAKESSPPFMHHMGPRFNRPQMTIPMEHQRPYVLPACSNTHPVLLQVSQRPAQYGNANWNFEQNNRRWMNNDPTQMNQFQEYQNQMMMHQRHVEQQRYYYQMEIQRNAWAAQTGKYPRNDWT